MTQLPLLEAAHTREQRAKREALSDLAERRRVILDYLRERLKWLYFSRVRDHGREEAYVTADDARDFLDAAENLGPLPNLNFLGALFRTAEWKPTGRVVYSRTPGSHANRLFAWRYVGGRR